MLGTKYRGTTIYYSEQNKIFENIMRPLMDKFFEDPKSQSCNDAGNGFPCQWITRLMVAPCSFFAYGI